MTKINKKEKKILILGAGGLIGGSVLKELIRRHHCNIAVVSLKDNRTREKIVLLGKNKKINIKKYWINILVPYSLQKYSFSEIFKHTKRKKIFLNYLKQQNIDLLNTSLFHIIKDFKPNYIIDCINIPTQCSYIDTSNIFNDSGIGLHILLKYYQNINTLLNNDFWLKQGIKMKILQYLKIGTTGIGGMGLNIPFTHGESKPSLPLLKKVAIAGAQTNILYGIKNNQYAEIKEIIPATAVFSKELNYKNVSSVKKFKNNFNNFHLEINGGESGYYTIEEFRLISNEKQMGFIDSQSLSKSIINGLFNNKHNILFGIEKCVIRSSKKSSVIRQNIINRAEKIIKKKDIACVAHGRLGPNKISKLLFEAKIFIDYYINNKKIFFNEQNKITSKKIFNKIINNKKIMREIKYSHLYIINNKIKGNSDQFININKDNCLYWKQLLKLIIKKKKILSPGDVVSELLINKK